MSMAHLEVMGEFQGPGEERTATRLAAELPAGWYVIAGRKLSGESRDDLDLVVVGDWAVFVLEEKFWGRRLELHDQYWRVGGDERRNPLDRVNHLARALAGRMRTWVPGYIEASRGAHLVVAGVVLSNPAVEVTAGADFQDGDGVHTLDGAAGWLRSRDAATRGNLAGARAAVLKFLLGLQQRDERIERLGPYTIDDELAPIGEVRCFQARDGERVVLLRCYPLYGWAPDVDPRAIVERERLALQRLDDLDRGWRVQASFVHEARQWTVVPLVPPRPSNSLVASVFHEEPPRVEGHLPREVGVNVVRDAFIGLHEVHEQGLLHRGLHPRRIYLGRGLRVKFGDFYLARLAGAATVAANPAADADLGVPYRAPECREAIGFGSRASDVYSLALSLSVWLLGDIPDFPDVPAIRDRLAGLAVVGPVLARCLKDAPGDRPTAEEVAAVLAVDVVVPPSVGGEIAVGTMLAGRYEILQRLGRGGSAETWLARDGNLGERRVIKCFLSDVGADAKAEFAVADRIRHPQCAKVYDAVWTPPPGYLVLEYVEGSNLHDYFSTDRPSAEQCRTIALDVLDGLRHIHEIDLVHRDVTPRNIIVMPGDRAKLIDFGLSTAPSALSVVGTPPFTAPEVPAGRGATAQSDLYGLAVTMIWLMLGRYPYAGDPASGADRRTELITPTVDERQLWGAFGAGLLDVLFEAADADPARRPTDAVEFADKLRLLDDLPQSDGGEVRVNDTVRALRQLYRGSSVGNAGNRGLEDEFAQTTYVSTLLDAKLRPAILRGDLRLVLLTGNPGDGKTSFLVKVGEALEREGARTLSADEAGWRRELRGHTYVAVYDASEAHAGLSSDDLMRRAMTPAPDEDPARRTVLLAINDGRLLEFFTDHRSDYPTEHAQIRRQLHGDPAGDAGVVLVDLKRRTLAPRPDGLSLARQILDLFVTSQRWSVCDGCVSRTVCPMTANAEHLRDGGADAVDELLAISHLRRQRRATFRDVRSALAWLITGDRGCEDVHVAREAQMDLRRGVGTRTEDLAFDPDSADNLVQEWSVLDPGAAVAPEVERAARADRAIAEHPAAFSAADRVRVQRQLYFGLWSPEGASRRSVRTYRYFDEFNAALAAPPGQLRGQYLPRVLLGLSRMLGAPGYQGTALALSDRQTGGDWAIIKEIPAADFELTVPVRTSPYIETCPDTLVLRHPHARLPLTLDTAELVLRLADGELIGDNAARAIQQEIENFSSRLRSSPSSAVRIVDPAGRAARAHIDGAHIVLEVSR
jgi:serine/threonine protein kinase